MHPEHIKSQYSQFQDSLPPRISFPYPHHNTACYQQDKSARASDASQTSAYSPKPPTCSNRKLEYHAWNTSPKQLFHPHVPQRSGMLITLRNAIRNLYKSSDLPKLSHTLFDFHKYPLFRLDQSKTIRERRKSKNSQSRTLLPCTPAFKKHPTQPHFCPTISDTKILPSPCKDPQISWGSAPDHLTPIPDGRHRISTWGAGVECHPLYRRFSLSLGPGKRHACGTSARKRLVSPWVGLI